MASSSHEHSDSVELSSEFLDQVNNMLEKLKQKLENPGQVVLTDPLTGVTTRELAEDKSNIVSLIGSLQSSLGTVLKKSDQTQQSSGGIESIPVQSKNNCDNPIEFGNAFEENQSESEYETDSEEALDKVEECTGAFQGSVDSKLEVMSPELVDRPSTTVFLKKTVSKEPSIESIKKRRSSKDEAITCLTSAIGQCKSREISAKIPTEVSTDVSQSASPDSAHVESLTNESPKVKPKVRMPWKIKAAQKRKAMGNRCQSLSSSLYCSTPKPYGSVSPSYSKSTGDVKKFIATENSFFPPLSQSQSHGNVSHSNKHGKIRTVSQSSLKSDESDDEDDDEGTITTYHTKPKASSIVEMTSKIQEPTTKTTSKRSFVIENGEVSKKSGLFEKQSEDIKPKVPGKKTVKKTTSKTPVDKDKKNAKDSKVNQVHEEKQQKVDEKPAIWTPSPETTLYVPTKSNDVSPKTEHPIKVRQEPAVIENKNAFESVDSSVSGLKPGFLSKAQDLKTNMVSSIQNKFDKSSPIAQAPAEKLSTVTKSKKDQPLYRVRNNREVLLRQASLDHQDEDPRHNDEQSSVIKSVKPPVSVQEKPSVLESADQSGRDSAGSRTGRPTTKKVRIPLTDEAAIAFKRRSLSASSYKEYFAEHLQDPLQADANSSAQTTGSTDNATSSQLDMNNASTIPVKFPNSTQDSLVIDNATVNAQKQGEIEEHVAGKNSTVSLRAKSFEQNTAHISNPNISASKAGKSSASLSGKPKYTDFVVPPLPTSAQKILALEKDKAASAGQQSYSQTGILKSGSLGVISDENKRNVPKLSNIGAKWESAFNKTDFVVSEKPWKKSNSCEVGGQFVVKNKSKFSSHIDSKIVEKEPDRVNSVGTKVVNRPDSKNKIKIPKSLETGGQNLSSKVVLRKKDKTIENSSPKRQTITEHPGNDPKRLVVFDSKTTLNDNNVSVDHENNIQVDSSKMKPPRSPNSGDISLQNLTELKSPDSMLSPNFSETGDVSPRSVFSPQNNSSANELSDIENQNDIHRNSICSNKSKSSKMVKLWENIAQEEEKSTSLAKPKRINSLHIEKWETGDTPPDDGEAKSVHWHSTTTVSKVSQIKTQLDSSPKIEKSDLVSNFNVARSASGNLKSVIQNFESKPPEIVNIKAAPQIQNSQGTIKENIAFFSSGPTGNSDPPVKALPSGIRVSKSCTFRHSSFEPHVQSLDGFDPHMQLNNSQNETHSFMRHPPSVRRRPQSFHSNAMGNKTDSLPASSLLPWGGDPVKKSSSIPRSKVIRHGQFEPALSADSAEKKRKEIESFFRDQTGDALSLYKNKSTDRMQSFHRPFTRTNSDSSCSSSSSTDSDTPEEEHSRSIRFDSWESLLRGTDYENKMVDKIFSDTLLKDIDDVDLCSIGTSRRRFSDVSLDSFFGGSKNELSRSRTFGDSSIVSFKSNVNQNRVLLPSETAAQYSSKSGGQAFGSHQTSLLAQTLKTKASAKSQAQFGDHSSRDGLINQSTMIDVTLVNAWLKENFPEHNMKPSNNCKEKGGSKSYATSTFSSGPIPPGQFTGGQQSGAKGKRNISGPLFTLSTSLNRSASGVKDMILNWCQCRTRGYQGVKIENFSTSWNDGMAFCALIHHFYPDAFDFNALNPKNRKYNFSLAFRVADEKAGVFPLLDVEDMVMMQKPDWKCVFTYVQTLYKRLKDE